MWLRNVKEKKKKTFVLSTSLRIPDPYLLYLERQTPLSSSGTPRFLSIGLGIDSLSVKEIFEECCL